MMQKKNVGVNSLEQLQLHVCWCFGKNFRVFPTTVKGASMKPTLQDGDKVIVNKLAKQFDRREDIIVVKTDNFYVKGLLVCGDVIEVRNDRLYVNHEVIEEAYLQSNKNKLKKLMNLTEDFGPITVLKIRFLLWEIIA